MYIAESQVSVTNNVNTSANTSSGNQSTTHTTITTTTNGETTKIESNDAGSIHVQTIDGKTTVQTSPGTNVVISPSIAPSPTPETSPIPSPVNPVASPSSHAVNKQEVETFIEKVQELIEDFLSKLGFGR